MICARPSASFWSVLFICILSAALACRASRQVTSRLRARSSCTSHGVIGPVSIPSLASSPACSLTTRAICSGSVAHWPRQSRAPVSSTTQIEVSFCETSSPTNRAIEPPPTCEPPSDTLGSQHYEPTLSTAITRCPDMWGARSTSPAADDPATGFAERRPEPMPDQRLHRSERLLWAAVTLFVCFVAFLATGGAGWVL